MTGQLSTPAAVALEGADGLARRDVALEQLELDADRVRRVQALEQHERNVVAGDVGVARYVIVSSIGADDPERGSGPMRPYLEAKAEADEALRNSGLDWTIVRPGGLTDAPGSGLVDARRALGRRGSIPRDDVALVLLECLQAPNTIGVQFELLEGDTPARDAVRAL